MTPQELTAAATAAGVAGLGGLFLPSLDTVWDADPADPLANHKLNRGIRVYLLVVLVVGVLHSLAVRSMLPLLIAGGVSGAVVHNYRVAQDTPPKRKGMLYE